MLTAKEYSALLNLCECMGDPAGMGMTEDELGALEAKLRAGPTNEFETRLTEAAEACRNKAGSRLQVRLDIIDLGVRVIVMSLLPRQECILICPWTDIALCCVNPLLSTIDRAIEKLLAARQSS